jgi:hypothetical protein
MLIDLVAAVFGLFLDLLKWIHRLAIAFLVLFAVAVVVAVVPFLTLLKRFDNFNAVVDWSSVLFTVVGLVALVVPLVLIDRFVLPLVGSWPCIDATPVSGDELVALQVEFQEATHAHQSHYRSFGIRLVSAYRVVNASLSNDFEARCALLRREGKSDRASRLYHGTSTPSAKAIVQSGFELPTRSGMFGKGIYFADTPLKSLQYTRSSGFLFGRKGVMLACDVALGNSMLKRAADNKLEAQSKKFKRGLIPRLFGKKSFDSVTADAGKLGAVRVPEYVVYDAAQALPKYVLIVEKHEK